MTVYVHLTGTMRYANQPDANAARAWAQTWAAANDARIYKAPGVPAVADLHNIPPHDDGGCTREITLDLWVMMPDGDPDALTPVMDEIKEGVYATVACSSILTMYPQADAPVAG